MLKLSKILNIGIKREIDPALFYALYVVLKNNLTFKNPSYKIKHDEDHILIEKLIFGNSYRELEAKATAIRRKVNNYYGFIMEEFNNKEQLKNLRKMKQTANQLYKAQKEALKVMAEEQKKEKPKKEAYDLETIQENIKDEVEPDSEDEII